MQTPFCLHVFFSRAVPLDFPQYSGPLGSSRICRLDESAFACFFFFFFLFFVLGPVCFFRVFPYSSRRILPFAFLTCSSSLNDVPLTHPRHVRRKRLGQGPTSGVDDFPVRRMTAIGLSRVVFFSRCQVGYSPPSSRLPPPLGGVAISVTFADTDPFPGLHPPLNPWDVPGFGLRPWSWPQVEKSKRIRAPRMFQCRPLF